MMEHSIDQPPVDDRTGSLGRLHLQWIDIAVVLTMIFAGAHIAHHYSGVVEAGPWFSSDRRDHLGAEYNSIAKAIAEGRGFSDPFRAGTGPTAWMPPVLPYFLACLYSIFGQGNNYVIITVLVLQCITLAAVGMIVVSESRRLGRASLGYFVLLVGYASNFRELFQTTHDVWLVMLIITALWWFGTRLPEKIHSRRGPWLWGLFGGFAALCGPVIGAAWAVFTCIRLFPRGVSAKSSEQASSRSTWKPLLIAAAVSIVVVTPWMIRNRVVMGKWMPIKSNGMYELWQSQCVDDNGIWDAVMASKHPWENVEGERRAYVESGEMQFIEERAEQVKEDIRNRPGEFAKRVARRFLAAIAVYEPFIPREWTQPVLLWMSRAVYVMPLVGVILICMAAVQGRLPTDICGPAFTAILIIALVLTPYCLVNYYVRYAAPLLPLKMLLVVYGLSTLLSSRISGKQSQRGSVRLNTSPT
ncbi:MAG: hypothetical protein U0892_18485 [Pirellulales bacterium]